MTSPKKFSLEELSQLSGIPRRSIRWYIQQQLVDKPEGLNRGAYYLEKHLDQLLLIRKWQENGLSLSHIRDILKGTNTNLLPPHPRRAGEIQIYSHILLDGGIELVIDPKEAELDTPQIQTLIRTVLEFLKTIRAERDEEKKESAPIVEKDRKEEQE